MTNYKPKIEINGGTILDCNAVSIYSELDFSNYLRRKEDRLLGNNVREVLDIVRPYNDPDFSGKSKLQDSFKSAKCIFEIFDKGYSLASIEKAFAVFDSEMSDRAKNVLDEAIETAWADYSGAHSEFVRMLGVLN